MQLHTCQLIREERFSTASLCSVLTGGDRPLLGGLLLLRTKLIIIRSTTILILKKALFSHHFFHSGDFCDCFGTSLEAGLDIQTSFMLQNISTCFHIFNEINLLLKPFCSKYTVNQ